MRLGRYFHVDMSLPILLVANILTIVFAVVYEWDIKDVIWIYWAQSFIIGLFNFLHILDLKNFSKEGYDLRLHLKMNLKSQMALFFMVHYGLLHIIFLVFLLYMWKIVPSVSALLFALCILAFFVTHGFDYWKNRTRNINRSPNIGDIVFYPYARILPMWLTLTLGMHYERDSLFILVLFLVLKTIADIIMHILDPVRISMTGIGSYRYENSREKEEEKPLKPVKVDLFKQNRPLSWWNLLITEIETWMGYIWYRSQQSFLFLIAIVLLTLLIIALIIFIIKLLVT